VTETSCFDFRVATFWQNLSKEIVQYHQPDSIVLLVSCSDFQPGGCEPFSEGPPADILCTELYYICFIQVLDGGFFG